MNPDAAAAAEETFRTLAPSVRFPVTIRVLYYGPNANLATRFLSSFFGNTEPSLLSSAPD